MQLTYWAMYSLSHIILEIPESPFSPLIQKSSAKVALINIQTVTSNFSFLPHVLEWGSYQRAGLRHPCNNRHLAAYRWFNELVIWGLCSHSGKLEWQVWGWLSLPEGQSQWSAQTGTFTEVLICRKLDHNDKSEKLMLIVDYTKECASPIPTELRFTLVTVWFGFES